MSESENVIEEALAALRKHGSHLNGCALMASAESPCTCGFMVALASLRKAAEGAVQKPETVTVFGGRCPRCGYEVCQ